MNIKLSQKQRILVASLYFLTLILIYRFVGGEFDALLGVKVSDSVIWFFSGALMIVMGAYIVEPLFTKPSDAIANSVAVLVALVGISHKSLFLWYPAIFWYALSVLVLALLCVALKDSKGPFLRKVGKTFYWSVEFLGSAKWMFSVVYLAASYSYFKNDISNFVIVITFWVVVMFFDVVGWIVKKVSLLAKILNTGSALELGTAIGCENPFLYRIEMNSRDGSVDYGHLVAIETSQNVGSVGMVINKKHLVNKRWLSVYLFRDEDGESIKINLRTKKSVSAPNSVFTEKNSVFSVKLDELPDATREKISESDLFKRKLDFVGYVTTGSNINTINFSVIREGDSGERQVYEGAVLVTSIYKKETLYQVINGNTKEEHLENFDMYGYVAGVARKLGTYDLSQKSLEVSKWVPAIYTPVFFAPEAGIRDVARRREMALNSIGHLPDTDLEVPIKDIDAIVTHNTAILGILGIGKSCLTFELIKRITQNGTKVFCIDITNQYFSEQGLNPYVGTDNISFDLNAEVKDTLKSSKDARERITEGNPQASGNAQDYRRELDKEIKSFIEGASKVKVFNPDLHPVSKGAAFRNTSLEDLTVAEKTRIISERVFVYAMSQGVSEKAKYALVFEEAHSLVPEWNSVANEGDKNATNGTAKVILQGRKYGLGSIVVTQRTANVSKSILNQCNTIFAMRVFDDTGKGFLANYIGEDYADTLPMLEERHAIAIGKGLRLKQPVIIRLNEVADVLPIKEVSGA